MENDIKPSSLFWYNILPICCLVLTGFLAYINHDFWWLPLIGVLLGGVSPKTK